MQYINTNKIEKLKFDKDNIFIILDFDKTITSFDSQDSWDACGELLGEKFKENLNEYYKYYGAIELDYSINNSEKENYMIEWYDKCMNLYYEYKLTQEKLDNSIKQNKIHFRDGAKEFIKMAHKNNIPLIILSAGIGNVIREFLKINNCYFDNMYIISNFVDFDEKGNIKKFEDKMIHTLNKTMEGHLSRDFQKKIKERKYGILVGDLISDIKMAPEYLLDDVVKIGFLNQNHNLNKYKENFDIVLTEEDATFIKIKDLVFKNVSI